MTQESSTNESTPQTQTQTQTQTESQTPTDLTPAQRAWQVLDFIEAYPELHRQHHWFTITDHGIAGCFGGLTCILAGDTLKYTATRASIPPAANGGYFDDVIATSGRWVGNRMHARDRAFELLCISSGEENYTIDKLINAYSSAAEIRHAVQHLFGDRPDDVPPIPRVTADGAVQVAQPAE